MRTAAAAWLLIVMVGCGGGGGGGDPGTPPPTPPAPPPPTPPDPPVLSIAAAAGPEGDAPGATLRFEVRLSAAAGSAVTVNYASSDGSARAGRDYEAVAGTLSFAPGETLRTVSVPLLGDRLLEGDETFTVTLSGLSAGAVAGTLQATGTVLDDEPARQRERLEMEFELPRSYANPFDPDEVELTLHVTLPDLSVLELPAFWYQDATIAGETPQRYAVAGTPAWRVRFAPTVTGEHRWQLRLRDADGTRDIGSGGRFEVAAGTARGVVRRDGRDGRFLRHDDGTPFIPIGHNVAWEDGSGLGTAYWDRTYGRMAAQGANWTRLHLIHYWDGQSLEWTPGNGYYQGLGRYSLELAWKIDQIVEAAERHGVHLQMVPFNSVMFSTTIFPQWDGNPFNQANAASGGFLAQPQDFFTDERAKALVRRQLRYLVARWGYSGAILAWELFNEADLVDGYYASDATRDAVHAWHAEMAAYLKSIDPARHLVSTSAALGGRFDPVWSLPEIDLVQHHNYRPGKVDGLVGDLDRLAALGKPSLIGEFGAEDQAAETMVDTLPEPERGQMREGLMLHNGNWAASVLGSGAMLWWWDVYIDALNLYPVYAPLAAFWAGEDPAAQGLSRAVASVVGGPQFDTLSLTPAVEGFYDTPTRTMFTIDANGRVEGSTELLRWLHGQGHEPQRSDPVFDATFARAGRFVVGVDEVSPFSAAVQVLIDGVVVHTVAYAGGETAREIAVAVPAGAHRIQLRNSGNDWLKIGRYGFEGLAYPAVHALGQLGPGRGYVWLHDRGSQYHGVPSGTVTGLALTLQGATDGSWDLSFRDTRDGSVVATGQAAANGGALRIDVPAFERDLALKLVRRP